MIRGIFIGRTLVAGVISFTLFLSRALYKFYPKSPILELFNDPLVAYILFLIAGVVIVYPFLKGHLALVISAVMVAFITFFVYAYYIV